MKLREIVDNIDLNKLTELNNIEHISRETGADLYWADAPRLKEFEIGPWLCTDTYVGSVVIFLDSTPVALSYQSARKNDIEFHWFSNEAFASVRAYLFEIKLAEDGNKIALADLDEELGDGYKIHYNQQIITHLTPNVLYNGELCEITKRGHLHYPKIDDWHKLGIRTSAGDEIEVTMENVIIPWRY